MDTGSHLLFGATLTGLAFVDPAVSGNQELAHALLAAVLLGSHAPDFDTVVRLKSYRHYLRYHRGISHSLPALFVWPMAIALPIAFGFGLTAWLPLLYGWTMVAVMFHVFLDWLNAYGVQCARPLDRKWRHMDALPLFDPLLFVLHLTGLAAWLWRGWAPEAVFPVVYGLTFSYIGLRLYLRGKLMRNMKERFGHNEGSVTLVPGLLWFNWQFVLETGDSYYTGSVRGRRTALANRYHKQQNHPAVQATLATAGVKTFLDFAEAVHVHITEGQDGFLVQWRDIRFWNENKLPFGVDVKLNGNLEVLKEQLYWNKKLWEPPYV